MRWESSWSVWKSTGYGKPDLDTSEKYGHLDSLLGAITGTVMSTAHIMSLALLLPNATSTSDNVPNQAQSIINLRSKGICIWCMVLIRTKMLCSAVPCHATHAASASSCKASKKGPIVPKDFPSTSDQGGHVLLFQSLAHASSVWWRCIVLFLTITSSC